MGSSSVILYNRLCLFDHGEFRNISFTVPILSALFPYEFNRRKSGNKATICARIEFMQNIFTDKSFSIEKVKFSLSLCNQLKLQWGT